MNARWLVVALATGAAMAVVPQAAYAQPEGVGVDVPITIALDDAQSGTCTYSFTPRSLVTKAPVGAGMYERGTNVLSGVVNCGTVTNRVTVIDTAPGLETLAATWSCSTTTGCTAVASQYAGYPTGVPGQVEIRTEVVARGVAICYADQWAAVGGVGATYVGGGFTECDARSAVIDTARQIHDIPKGIL
jgi:hypothetical protein